MHIIVNTSSMVPIYEQIVDQVKAAVIAGELGEGENLPSVRALAKELKISALTVKKAYDHLEQEGLTVTIHGKGTFVAAVNQSLREEERQKEIETEMEQVVEKALRCGLSPAELRSLFEIIIEEKQ